MWYFNDFYFSQKLYFGIFKKKLRANFKKLLPAAPTLIILF